MMKLAEAGKIPQNTKRFLQRLMCIGTTPSCSAMFSKGDNFRDFVC